MSGIEVISTLSAVIDLLRVSIDVWNKAQKDLNIGKTFELVASRLPILKETLEICYRHIEPIKATLPADEASALVKTLQNCKTRSEKMEAIFQATIAAEGESWFERYRKVARRWGKTTKVEDLMKLITEDVQIVVNYRSVKSAEPGLEASLENIITEMKSAEPSLAGDEAAFQEFNALGGPMYVSTGNSTMHPSYHTGSGEAHYYGGISGSNPVFYIGKGGSK